jgi:hypothetical protein
MLKTPEKMMATINGLLSEYQQKIRVVEWSGAEIQLSNGDTLTGNQRLRFIKRIQNKKTDIWIRHMDDLLTGDISEKEIRAKLASLGGISCQKIYGDKIKQNLNTGIPWSKGKNLKNYVNKKGEIYQPWQTGKTKDDNETLKRLSESRMGSGNPMFGHRHSDEYKNQLSQMMKQKILNGEFTPNSNNRRTYFKSFLDNKAYRSSWEALYQYINPSAEYEKLRITYRFKDEQKIYIVDFVDHKNKLAVEVKPKEMCTGDKFLAKIHYLNEWCQTHNYQLLLVTQHWLKQYKYADIDFSRFDDDTQKKIKRFYETCKKD